jgi:thiamine-monophosphate kinase
MHERELLRRIFDVSTGLGPEVVIGPGDDMAMLRPAGWSFSHGGAVGGDSGGGVLLAVDQLIEGVHFSRTTASLSQVGHKAMARCLSDVAAMAGKPRASLVSAALPPSMSDDDAMELFDAMRTTADMFHAPIVGGDLAAHRSQDHPLICSITVMAEATDRGAVSRFGARVGDLVCVTGSLGGSLDSGRHLDFQPRIGESIMLHAILSSRLHSMIDLSDGLGVDAARMLEGSNGLQVRIDAGALPCHDGVDWRAAVSDGEDYELLCMVSPGDVPTSIVECPLTVIGEIVARPSPEMPPVVVFSDGAEHDVSSSGWEHQG